MKDLLRFTALVVASLLVLAAAPAAQKSETVDGVRVVPNVEGGLWGKTPRISLGLVRKIGDIDTEDEHVAFNYPSDVAVDRDGNIYILDTGNTRIQKFGPDGKFLATIGRKGQGPGEFIMPDGIYFDRDGNLVVGDSAQSRLHVIIGGGKDSKAVILKDERLYGLRCLAGGGYVGRASTCASANSRRPRHSNSRSLPTPISPRPTTCWACASRAIRLRYLMPSRHWRNTSRSARAQSRWRWPSRSSPPSDPRRRGQTLREGWPGWQASYAARPALGAPRRATQERGGEPVFL